MELYGARMIISGRDRVPQMCLKIAAENIVWIVYNMRTVKYVRGTHTRARTHVIDTDVLHRGSCTKNNRIYQKNMCAA